MQKRTCNQFIAYWSNPEKGATYKQVPVIKNIIKNEKKPAGGLIIQKSSVHRNSLKVITVLNRKILMKMI